MFDRSTVCHEFSRLVEYAIYSFGRDVALLGKPFLFVPIPLAVFPVLYYLCAAIWMSNLPAAAVMAVFGIAHIAVSVRSF